MTNEQIIKEFCNPFGGDTTTRKALCVRGGKLYSYNLLIAEYITEEGFSGILVHDHWAKGLGSVSSTTSQHVGLIVRATKHFPRKLQSERQSIFN